MRAKSRIKSIEKELQDQLHIPPADKFIVIFPSDSEEVTETRIAQRLSELRQRFGEAVSRQDIDLVRVVYDSSKGRQNENNS